MKCHSWWRCLLAAAKKVAKQHEYQESCKRALNTVSCPPLVLCHHLRPEARSKRAACQMQWVGVSLTMQLCHKPLKALPSMLPRPCCACAPPAGAAASGMASNCKASDGHSNATARNATWYASCYNTRFSCKPCIVQRTLDIYELLLI